LPAVVIDVAELDIGALRLPIVLSMHQSERHLCPQPERAPAEGWAEARRGRTEQLLAGLCDSDVTKLGARALTLARKGECGAIRTFLATERQRSRALRPRQRGRGTGS